MCGPVFPAHFPGARAAFPSPPPGRGPSVGHRATAQAWPFAEPVDANDVPDYYEIVRNPVSLHLIGKRLESGHYYLTLEMFAADFRNMFVNCRIYNSPDTEYYKCAGSAPSRRRRGPATRSGAAAAARYRGRREKRTYKTDRCRGPQVRQSAGVVL